MLDSFKKRELARTAIIFRHFGDPSTIDLYTVRLIVNKNLNNYMYKKAFSYLSFSNSNLVLETVLNQEQDANFASRDILLALNVYAKSHQILLQNSFCKSEQSSNQNKKDLHMSMAQKNYFSLVQIDTWHSNAFEFLDILVSLGLMYFFWAYWKRY